MKKRWSIVLSIAVILLPMVYGFLHWNELPERMITHWNLSGTPDGSRSRLGAVVLTPLILASAQIVIIFISRYTQRKHPGNLKVLYVVDWIFPAVSLYAGLMMYRNTLSFQINPVTVVLVLTGCMFIFLGNILPKIEKNSTFGVRTTWTLHSEDNWFRTHRFTGKVWVIAGIGIVCTSFLQTDSAMLLFMIFLVLAVLAPVVYSYLYYRKERKGNTIAPVPAKTIWITVFTTVVIVGGMFVLMKTGSITYTFQENELVIKPTFSNKVEIAYADIESIAYESEGVPGIRTNGYGSMQLLYGTFENEQFGEYTRYTYTKTKPCAVLQYGERIIVLNAADDAETEALYQTLQKKWKEKQ